MKRRQAIRSLLGLPAITALPAIAQQAPIDESKPPAGGKLPAEMAPPPVEENPKLATSAPDAAAPAAPVFFSAKHLLCLRRLADLLVPALEGRPGAIAAGVPEFLDFLIAESPEDRQILYRSGLDRLDSESMHRFGKLFPAIPPQDAGELLAPLRQAWSFAGPPDPLARFLHAAKADILQATVNSREWAAATPGRRASAGVGSYWYSLE